MSKTSQLQIRVSPAQKAGIQRAARRAGKDVSSWVLDKLLPPEEIRFQECIGRLAVAAHPSYSLAELNDLLTGLGSDEFQHAVATPPQIELEPYLSNYVAAMVELAAQLKGVSPPAWVASIPPQDVPVFGSELMSLRLHLLTQSPPPFRRRNIFIDASIGDRV
jgi:hypothetical protein